MNITFEKSNELNGTLTMKMEENDYRDKVTEQLKKYRQQANIPGFRKGQAPMGMIKKMVGKSITLDTINSVASESLNNYIKEENLDILGYPMASKEKNSEIDLDNVQDVTLHFDMGLAPSFEINLSEKDKLTRFEIELPDAEVDKEIENIANRYGTMSDVEEIISEKDSIEATITELDGENNPLEGGINDKTATFLPEMIKDEETKKLFTSVKVGDVVNANIHKVFNDNESVLSTTTGLPKEGVKDLSPNFSFTVNKIRNYIPSEINQDLFDKVFGEGTVKDEAEFRAKITENIQGYYGSQAEQLLNHEVDHLVLDKHKVDLPEEFLKRWMIETRAEEYTEENIDERFDKEADVLRYQLFREKMVEKYNIELSKEELDQTSIDYTVSMMRQYGIYQPTPEQIGQFLEAQKQDQNFQRQIRDLTISQKVTAQVKELITIKGKKISVEDFAAKQKEHEHHNH